MDAFRRALVRPCHEILIDALRHKRDHRRGRLRNRHKRRIQCHIGIDLILFHTTRPKTFTAPADIPVTHIIDKILQRPRRFGDTVITKMAVDLPDHGIQLTEKPFIHHAVARLRLIDLVIVQFIF